LVPLEDPVGGRREHEEDPDEDLDAQPGRVEGGANDVVRLREVSQPPIDRDERIMLPAGLLLTGLGAQGVAADRGLHLVDRNRDDEPQQEPDERRDGEIVEPDAEATRDPAGAQPLDARTHGGRDDERQEEQSDQHPELPEREHGHDDADDD
jgi:hypothetical protein